MQTRKYCFSLLITAFCFVPPHHAAAEQALDARQACGGPEQDIHGVNQCCAGFAVFRTYAAMTGLVHSGISHAEATDMINANPGWAKIARAIADQCIKDASAAIPR